MKIRSILSAVIFLLAIGLELSAQSRPDVIKGIDKISTEAQLSEWVTYYYLHPRPDLVVSAVKFMSKQGHLQDAHAENTFCVFLARVFAANPADIGTWFNKLREGPEDQESALALVLWMVGSSDTNSLLKSLSGAGSDGFKNYVHELLADNHRPDYLHDEISSPEFLDALWVSFFATGDDRYVKRIISALPLLNAEGDTEKILIGGAARWSLSSNASQHPKVMEICEAQLKVIPEEQRPALAEVIQSAQERKK
jgi:hypothetical protein